MLSTIYSLRYKKENLKDSQQIKTLCNASPKIIYYCLKNIKDYNIALCLITTIIYSLATSRLDSELIEKVENLFNIINSILPEQLVSSKVFIIEHKDFYIELDRIISEKIIPIRNKIIPPTEDLFELEELIVGEENATLRNKPVPSIFNEKSPHNQESLKRCASILDYISQELIEANLIAKGFV